MSNDFDYGVVHLYPQYCEHFDGYVAGDRRGLERLRDAITLALDVGEAELMTMASDAEGYLLYVVRVPDEKVPHLMTAYSSEFSEDTRQNAVHPYYLLSPSQQDSGSNKE
jgi:hypothetical protein